MTLASTARPALTWTRTQGGAWLHRAAGGLESLLFEPPDPADPTRTMLLANARVPRAWDRGHFLLTGSTGSGKSTVLKMLIESLLTHPPDDLDVFNAFLFDPQNDLYRTILALDLPLEVILTNVFDRRAWGWDLARDLAGNPAAAEQLAYALIPAETGSGENRFFAEAPRAILAAVLRELVNRGRPWTLRQAYLVALDSTDAERLCATSTDPMVRHTLRLFDASQGSTRANIDSSLLIRLRPLATYTALLERARRQFTLDDLVRGDVVVVAGGDHEFKAIVNPFQQLLLTMLKNKLVGQEESETRRHYVFIDEFAALNGNQTADEVLDFFVRGRSRGVRIGIVIHTPRQLVHLYGEPMTDVILGATQNQLIFKVNDYNGAVICSRELGQVHGYEWTHSVNISHTYALHGSVTHGLSASEQRVDYPRVHPDEIKSLPLASLEHGIRGFAVVPGDEVTARWRFHLTPEWLAEHAVPRDETIPSYESCRQLDAESQRLHPLGGTERAELGLAERPEGAVA